MAMKFVVCVNKEGFGDLSGEGVTIGHVYETIGDIMMPPARMSA